MCRKGLYLLEADAGVSRERWTLLIVLAEKGKSFEE